MRWSITQLRVFCFSFYYSVYTYFRTVNVHLKFRAATRHVRSKSDTYGPSHRSLSAFHSAPPELRANSISNVLGNHHSIFKTVDCGMFLLILSDPSYIIIWPRRWLPERECTAATREKTALNITRRLTRGLFSTHIWHSTYIHRTCLWAPGPYVGSCSKEDVG